MTIKKLTFILSAALSLTSAAALAQIPAKVTSLNVQDTTATFSLNAEKTHTACINGDTRQL
ncbi:hypothetical protein [Pseudoalteromonas rubra]|uniref:Uncharacterized protein n=1 Tax=Pseudoalteromonas rubra TaxID=43658 RepID=A0A0U3HUN7_9GAMM|nr:hypothetical protein [Pseudoalteromonas rubra]ALU44696.1 hypothetical protein AT705_18155 [Pseudoalteromonas rubra]